MPEEATNAGKDDHELVIQAADIDSKAMKTYDIQGVAAHAHGLTVTPLAFERLARGERVLLTTSVGDGHTHLVYLDYPRKTDHA